MSWSGRAIRSTIDKSGELVLSLEQVELTEPGDDEVIVRIEATPVNPSDSGMLLGPADLSDIREFDSRVTMTVPSERLAAIAGRLGQPMPVGNEGAGTVVAAGKNAQAFIGKRVGMSGGGMYADYRRTDMHNLIVLPEGVEAADGASIFINPLTALGFVETALREGHKALVHTAAASNLGQMLQRICLADGIPLINIVRTTEQEKILRELGATYVLNSKEPDFAARLTDAIEETGATVAFDAIGGGKLGIEIINAMERAAARKTAAYSRYGSTLFKQLYIYGGLDSAPTVLDRGGLGYAWSISGWLLFNYLNTVSPAVLQRLRQRIVDELTTTFASRYTRAIGLADLLDPDVLRALERKATGEKFLIDPRVG
ncbi:TPA: zinc-binding dehydrogenase [Citrobacter koseri]|uniref:zinc-binding dehydrogenase n=1 Tax=uncultured Citrobacter sp. TaxID=200446 RepID=UPI00259288C9|nr:zinc-binding dehydrogenase [uncultured Citrobacter sp.]